MNLKLHAVVNTEQGYVLIPDQIAYNHPTYGNIKAVALYNYNGSWYYEESIGMNINVDGSLTIPDYVFTIITSGAYSGLMYGNYYSSNNFSTMTDGNGIMIVTFNSTLSSDYTTQTYPVKLTQQGNVVAVENFLNMGPFNLAAADVNGEDGINVMDVTALINLVLSNE